MGVVEKEREKVDSCVEGDGLGTIDERRRVFELKSEEVVVDMWLVAIVRKERALKARLREAGEPCACVLVLATVGAASRRIVVKALSNSSASLSWSRTILCRW